MFMKELIKVGREILTYKNRVVYNRPCELNSCQCEYLEILEFKTKNNIIYAKSGKFKLEFRIHHIEYKEINEWE